MCHPILEDGFEFVCGLVSTGVTKGPKGDPKDSLGRGLLQWGEILKALSPIPGAQPISREPLINNILGHPCTSWAIWM